MVQHVGELVTKFANVSLIPGAHIVAEENLFPRVSL